MGYGGYGGVMMGQPPQMAMPMPVAMAMPMPYPEPTTTTQSNRDQEGGGYGTIVIPVPQFITVTVKYPDSQSNSNSNKNSCNNDNKKCPQCPPCSCNPCTPVVFSFCSPCHEQCKCPDSNRGSEERSRTSTSPSVFPMPFAPIIYVPLPDFNKNNDNNNNHGKHHKKKCESCAKADISCDSSSNSYDGSDSCQSHSKSCHCNSRGHDRKKDKFDICKRNGNCNEPSRRFRSGNGPTRRRIFNKRYERNFNKEDYRSNEYT